VPKRVAHPHPLQVERDIVELYVHKKTTQGDKRIRPNPMPYNPVGNNTNRNPERLRTEQMGAAQNDYDIDMLTTRTRESGGTAQRPANQRPESASSHGDKLL
jgi:hypothetical protein